MPEEAKPQRDDGSEAVGHAGPPTAEAGSEPREAAAAEPTARPVGLTKQPAGSAAGAPAGSAAGASAGSAAEPTPSTSAERASDASAEPDFGPEPDPVSSPDRGADSDPVAGSDRGAGPAGTGGLADEAAPTFVSDAPPAGTAEAGASLPAAALAAEPAAPTMPIWPTTPGGRPGAEPGTGPADGSAGDPADGAPATAPAGRWSGRRAYLIIGGIVVVLLVLFGIGGAMIYADRDKPTTAAAGDCLKGKGINPGSRQTSNVSLETVDCADAAARYRVVGRVDDQPESAANADSTLCNSFEGTEFIYWEGVGGKRGTVLCLATNKAK